MSCQAASTTLHKSKTLDNKYCVGEDIEDLEYTPKHEFKGYFKLTSVKNKEELIRLWFSHMREAKPGIYVTYNGDFFDWPVLENRVAHHGLRMNDVDSSRPGL